MSDSVLFPGISQWMISQTREALSANRDVGGDVVEVTPHESNLSDK